MKNNQNKVICHGEALIFPAANLPEDAKPIKPSNQKFHIIADSETTGNHHVIPTARSTQFYQDGAGTMFMVNEEPTKVECVLKNRHSPIEIGAGTWEFGIAQEYDHFLQQRRNVAD